VKIPKELEELRSVATWEDIEDWNKRERALATRDKWISERDVLRGERTNHLATMQSRMPTKGK